MDAGAIDQEQSEMEEDFWAQGVADAFEPADVDMEGPAEEPPDGSLPDVAEPDEEHSSLDQPDDEPPIDPVNLAEAREAVRISAQGRGVMLNFPDAGGPMAAPTTPIH